MKALCVFLVVFSTWCDNRRVGMAGESYGWTENRDFNSSAMSPIYSVTLYKWYLIVFVFNWWNCIKWFFLDCFVCFNKILQTEWLRKKWNLFLTVLKLEVWGQVACVVRGGSSSRSQASPCTLTWWRGHRAVPKLLYDILKISFMRAAQSSPDHLSKTPFLTPSRCEFGGTHLWQWSLTSFLKLN